MSNNTGNSNANNSNANNSTANNSTSNSEITTLKTDVTSLKSKVEVLENDIVGINQELTRMKDDKATEESDGWFSSFFGDDEEVTETFSNTDNELFFTIALIIILYYCLKK